MSKVRAIRAALEVALDAVQIVPQAAITVSAVGGSFTTAAPHGLTSGVCVRVAGHSGSTPSIAGAYTVQVIDDTTFSLLDVISNADIAITVGGTGGTVVSLLTAYENVDFKTNADAPYREVWHFNQMPVNPTFGAPFHREYGYTQINLYYPVGMGSGDALAHADAIQDAFPRGQTYSLGGDDVLHIQATPWIGQGRPDPNNGSYMIPVKIYYYADVFS